jgi:hypothetical protein
VFDPPGSLSPLLVSQRHHQINQQTGYISVLYYRGPSEPGGDDDILAEVVDGKFRRLIEISNGSARCGENHGYPFADVTAEAVADYVWPHI